MIDLRRPIFFVPLAISAALIMLLALSSTLKDGPAPAPANPMAAIGGPFELINQDGETVTHESFKGKYMLVFFGFTHCPDICPLAMQIMASTFEEMGKKAERIQPIFITVDPARDTPEVLKAYTSLFDLNLQGLTGSAEAVDQAAKAYKVFYRRVDDPSSSDGYSMDHFTGFYLMSPEGEFVELFRYNMAPEELARLIGRQIK